MKHGKRPTVRQKKLMATWRLNPEDWLIVKDTADSMTVVHRLSDKTVWVIPKGERYETL